MTIKILEEALINKIAAGEVIERPASVIKELIENSIDAGADEIIIKILKSGKKQIIVKDNGSGMDPDDAQLSIVRHATSKLLSDEDLFNINTLGFRGEALASIAAVSNFILTSKTKEDLTGIKIEVEGGNIRNLSQVGISEGTTIEINDLFFNMPARKQFLKEDSTELNHIIDIINRYALINPQISFKLIHNDNELINAPKTNNWLDKIISIYGKEIVKDLIEISYEDSVKIKGFISKPILTKKDKDFQSIYVNGRYVKDKIISDAVHSAYHTLLNVHRFPVFIINLEINPKEIDVNVHPTKALIKIKAEDLIQDQVYSAIRDTLMNNNLIQNISEIRTSQLHSTQERKYEISSGTQTILEPIRLEEKKEEIKFSKLPKMKILGQIYKTYILAEGENGLLIIDQHAAQERVMYEKFMQQEYQIKSQNLITPNIIELPLIKYNLLKNNLDKLKDIGFELEEYGQNSFILRSIPIFFDLKLGKEILLELLDEISKYDEIKEEKIIRSSCRAAIKAGENLNIFQMQGVLKELELTEQPYNCPHGRPTIINISIQELEKKFKRILG